MCGIRRGYLAPGFVGIHRVVVSLVLLLMAGIVNADGLPERRRDQFAGEFSYYLYPIAGEVPGLGRTSGGGASVLNIAGSSADFTAFKLDGDFSASGYTLLDLPLVQQRLIADVGTYDFDVAQVQYGRGIDSSADNTILPHAEGTYHIGQLTLSFDQRRYETYLRWMEGGARLLDVRDSDGVAFSSIDNSWRDNRQVTLGTAIDLTDDHLDPRTGIRFEAALKMPRVDDSLRSEYVVTDLNLSGYLPVRQHKDTLVVNLFRSDAHITDEGETDYATLQAERGLSCDTRPSLEEQKNCYRIEARYLNEFIAANRFGTATSLGGTQRLRSFDNGRFYAGHAIAYGIEYRWNLTDENTPFDIIIAKGVRTGIQLAAFAEAGTVTDDLGELLKNPKHSYGLGFRVILSGIVLRADLATGEEGKKFQLFISYPWSMFSVDSPG